MKCYICRRWAVYSLDTSVHCVIVLTRTNLFISPLQLTAHLEVPPPAIAIVFWRNTVFLDKNCVKNHLTVAMFSLYNISSCYICLVHCGRKWKTCGSSRRPPNVFLWCSTPLHTCYGLPRTSLIAVQCAIWSWRLYVSAHLEWRCVQTERRVSGESWLQHYCTEIAWIHPTTFHVHWQF